MKSIAIGTVISLIIGVIVLIVVVPLILRAGRNVWNSIMESLGWTTYTDIETAIICSNLICNVNYDRSKLGCPDNRVFEEICYPFLERNNLLKEVCTIPSVFNQDPCNTFSFPIEVEIKTEKDAQIKTDKIKNKIAQVANKFKELDYIKRSDVNVEMNMLNFLLLFTTPGSFLYLINVAIKAKEVNFVYLPQHILTSYEEKEESQDWLNIQKLRVITGAKFKYPQKYWVYSYKGKYTTAGITADYIITQVFDYQTYYVLGDAPLEIPFNKEDFEKDKMLAGQYFRIKLEDQSESVLNNIFFKMWFDSTGGFLVSNFDYDKINMVIKYFDVDSNLREVQVQINDGGTYRFVIYNSKVITIKYVKGDPSKIIFTQGESSGLTNAVFIPSDRDFCEQPTMFWKAGKDSEINFLKDKDRGTVIEARRSLTAFADYAEIIFDYSGWKGESLDVNQIDKINFCIKYLDTGDPRKIAPQVYNLLLGITLVDTKNDYYYCEIKSKDLVEKSKKEWVCLSVSIDSGCKKVGKPNKLSQIKLFGRAAYLLDSLNFCKGC